MQNASFWLDLRIIMMTLRVMIWGQRRPREAMASQQYLRTSNELSALAAPQWAKRGIG